MSRTLIDICNTSYEIREVSSGRLKKMFGVEELKIDGMVDFEQETIYINRSLTPYRKAVTLVHECLHIVYDHVGARFVDVEEEESLIGQLEHGVLELINSFPDKYRQEGD